MQNFYDCSPLNNLQVSTMPKWGIMSAQHMVEHLILALKSGSGKITFDRFITPKDKLIVMKRFLNSSRPLPKLFVNEVVGKELKPLQNKDLVSAIKELENEIKYFDEYFAKFPTTEPINATFGPLNKEEWIQFHNKHFTHHYTQFGLI